jgi:hypothetical protein
MSLEMHPATTRRRIDVSRSKRSRSSHSRFFHILACLLGAQGPDLVIDHRFDYIKDLADALAQSEIDQGIDPIDLDPDFPGLHDVFRDRCSLIAVTNTFTADLIPARCHAAKRINADCGCCGARECECGAPVHAT